MRGIRHRRRPHGAVPTRSAVLASLNHPHIAAIYGFEDSGGVRALVMELVEGPTLADRIGRGAIPLDEALPIAREIAEALEAAQERNIVHRDLKPANIKIAPDGNVKVLDFGLAKAIEGDSSSIDIQNSPTISRMATQAGIILGTAAYLRMAPAVLDANTEPREHAVRFSTNTDRCRAEFRLRTEAFGGARRQVMSPGCGNEAGGVWNFGAAQRGRRQLHAQRGTTSLIAQSDDGVDAHGAAGGDIAGC